MDKAKKGKTVKKAPDKEVKRLAERIKALRIKAGYTNHEHFAYDKNINRVQYFRYEKGEDLRYTSLLRVIKAHGMTQKEFFSEGFED